MMTGVSLVNSAWLAPLASNSPLLKLGNPVESPLPFYDSRCDEIFCHVGASFGQLGSVDPYKMNMRKVCLSLGSGSGGGGGGSTVLVKDDHYRWFARFLLEGKIVSELKELGGMLKDEPAKITKRKPSKIVALLVNELKRLDVFDLKGFKRELEKDKNYLWEAVKSWCVKDKSVRVNFLNLWRSQVKLILKVGY